MLLSVTSMDENEHVDNLFLQSRCERVLVVEPCCVVSDAIP